MTERKRILSSISAMADHYYYCPYCGHIVLGDDMAELYSNNRTDCPNCFSPLKWTKSLHDTDYYTKKSIEKHNDVIKGVMNNMDILREEEIKINPLFDAEKAKMTTVNDKAKAYREVEREKLNVPKCPTCGSTNIKKISTSAKAVGAIAFGLLSKTARSQFKCNNCGYKW